MDVVPYSDFPGNGNCTRTSRTTGFCGPWNSGLASTERVVRNSSCLDPSLPARLSPSPGQADPAAGAPDEHMVPMSSPRCETGTVLVLVPLAPQPLPAAPHSAGFHSLDSPSWQPLWHVVLGLAHLEGFALYWAHFLKTGGCPTAQGTQCLPLPSPPILSLASAPASAGM